MAVDQQANQPIALAVPHSVLFTNLRRGDFIGLKIMGEFAIGQSVLRREDPRLLRGQGRCFDDLKLPDQLHAAIVRSPHAHADITGIDTRAALQMPGVRAVLTGADYRADGLGSLPSMAAYQRRGGGPMFLPPRPAIASDRVMHI